MLIIVESQGDRFHNEVKGDPAPERRMKTFLGFEFLIPFLFQDKIIVPIPSEGYNNGSSTPIDIIHGDIGSGRLGCQNHAGTDASGSR